MPEPPSREAIFRNPDRAASRAQDRNGFVEMLRIDVDQHQQLRLVGNVRPELCPVGRRDDGIGLRAIGADQGEHE
jgi:hypothetical protein